MQEMVEFLGKNRKYRKIETNKAIGQMLYHFAKNPSAYVFQKFQKNLNANLKHVQESELFFAEELLSFIKKIDPSHDDWKVFQNDEKGRNFYLFINFLRKI
jgi:hypothetical protein